MLGADRKAVIVKIVNERQSVTIQELVEFLDTSASTIRRDLNELAAEGKLVKVFGGAHSLEEPAGLVVHDDYFAHRLTQNRAAKQKIGRVAANLVDDNDLVYIDAGTSTYLMIEYLYGSRATFVTNGIKQAQALAGAQLKTYLLGGHLKIDTEAIVGGEAIRSLDRYNFTKGFFGANGITVAGGLMTPESSEASVKEKALAQCAVAYVLCDKSKFNNKSMVTFAPIDAAIIITDQLPNRTISEKTEVIEAK